MKFSNLLALGISLSLALSACVGATENGTNSDQPCNFPAIYNFGGSNSDTGGMSASFYPLPPPNGRTFFQRPVGRASDGRLVIDFIAEHLKLPHLSAYLNSLEANFAKGANFAALEATILGTWEGTYLQTGLSTFKLPHQVNVHFDQFKNRTIDLYNQGKHRDSLPKPEDFSRALYTLDIGHTDFTYGFRVIAEDQLRARMPEIVNSLTAHVEVLYDKGARSFWIQNARPVGCLPNTTISISDPKPGSLDQNGCLKSQNEIVTEFNKQLKDKVIELRTKLPEASITLVDVYTAEYDLISSANSHGFTDPLKICCGIHENAEYVKCGNRGIVNGKQVFADSCKNPEQYISWDGIHRTEAANQWIANRIVDGSLSDPPVPIAFACQKMKM
ncbi:GDSL esterase/lipase At5g14450-like [Diospyros lotus]|uniref:GDSL esterase/lipase At5g14450-like n=1 Tax=Diospyros lotus TaxID=55363 RepID=UPI00224F67FB|nr:GDSL esterase/lipase At5g14450-like [Diospyros lotus]